jgi:hypothetical protein
MTETIRMRILNKSAATLLGATLAQGGAAYTQQSPSQMEMSSDAVDAVVTLGIAFEDNIFSNRNDKEGDEVTIFSPSIAYGESIGLYELVAQADAEFGWYKSNSAEDYQDYSASLELSRNLVGDDKVYAGVRFGRDHEERQSADDENGLEPTLFSQSKAYAGYRSSKGLWRTTLVGTFQTLNFDDANSAVGQINNDDRDRDLAELGLRLAKKTTDKIEVFGQLTYDVRNYRSSLDDAGFERDSTGGRASIGVRYKPDQKLDAELFGGLLYRNYNGPRFEDEPDFDIGTRIIWNPVPNSHIEGRIDRSILETTLTSSSGYNSTTGQVNLSQALRPEVLVYMGIGYTSNDYREVERHDHLLFSNIGGRYFFTPQIFGELGYQFTQRDSSNPDDDFTSSRLLVSLGMQLEPAFDSADKLRAPSFNSSGFYGGFQLGQAALATELEGPRGSGGTLSADFGEFGNLVGLFAGYSIDVSNWFLALEGEVNSADLAWSHSRDNSGRIFSVERDSGYSLGILSGYRLDQGARIYGRAGATQVELATSYVDATRPYNANEALTGIIFGLGAMAPLSETVSVRMEYTLTSYEDYALAGDNFANSEGTFLTGFLYGLGNKEKDHSAQPVDWSGAYFGGQVGYGMLNTWTTGPRKAGSILIADFGDEGATGGLYAGYGIQFGPAYIGGEAEWEDSDVSWDHQRDPTGRIFVVRKNESFGGSLRLGFVLRQSSLLYVRAGMVRTDFDTRFEAGNERLAADMTLDGARYGIGLEVMAQKRVSLRFDYTRSDYDDYVLVFENEVTERHEAGESIFRIGVAYRF